MSTKVFSLGKEGGDDGSFKRQASKFRSMDVEAEPGRYHLYVSWACPWAHRTVIARRLKGLEEVIGMSAVDPIRDERGWRFTGGEYVAHAHAFTTLGEASPPSLWPYLRDLHQQPGIAETVRLDEIRGHYY